MKFASRISSIRRMAWKQCRSCSADSLSMCAGLVRQVRARRMDALAARLQHRGDRVLREPVDLEVGVELAQLVGDRGVALGVAEADRRGDVERALAARLAADPAARGRTRGVTNSRRSRLTLTGSRTCGPWPEPSSRTSSPPVASASAIPRPGPVIASSAPWITSTGQRTRPHSSRDGRPRRGPRRLRRDERLRRRLEPPADAVLDRLRRVRLREHLREEELEEAAVVAEPVVAVVLRPAFVGVELLVPRVQRALARAARRAARPGR